MSETFTCGDHGALVSYLYDECAPNERRAISTHVAICRECAEELTSLGATREQLATWTPPGAQLGFRIVSDSPSSNILRPSRWWQKPMPAWAQAAAAALIFATGVTLGALRGVTSPADRGPTGSAPQQANATTLAANTTSVTRADLAALEQRLRSELSQGRSASTTVSASNTSDTAAAAPGDARILERVRAMVQDSEQRQQRELALRTAEVVRDFDAQRRDDLTRIERTMGQMDGTTGVEVAQQRQMLNYLMRVSQRGQ
jgi:hypothetical protein